MNDLGLLLMRPSYWDIQQNILVKTQSLFRFLLSALGRKSRLQEVTALPSRVTGYKQAEQLFGLRHKPITLQDALPRSDSSRDNLPRPDPLSLAETSPLSSNRSRISKPLYKRSRSIDN
ncbi:hypothetical protein V6N13_051228 [Hibiscus sabdariffa]